MNRPKFQNKRRFFSAKCLCLCFCSRTTTKKSQQRNIVKITNCLSVSSIIYTHTDTERERERGKSVTQTLVRPPSFEMYWKRIKRLVTWNETEMCVLNHFPWADRVSSVISRHVYHHRHPNTCLEIFLKLHWVLFTFAHRKMHRLKWSLWRVCLALFIRIDRITHRISSNI